VVCELDPVKAAKRDAAMLAELRDPDAVTVEPPQPRLGEPSITEEADDNAGRLSVQGRVEVDGVLGLYDDVVGGTFELIGLDIDPSAGLPAELAAWFISIGGEASEVSAEGAIRDVDGSYRTWFDARGCSVALSRPDFYVFGTGSPADATRLLADLREALDGRSVRANEFIEEGVSP
jgi:3-(3-hydroxy-phenyl)propionate hydroxylase